MTKVHLDVGGGRVACGSETSWRTRGIELIDLERTKVLRNVTCKRCAQTWQTRRLGGL